ncbi:MAG TPA: hypothetical protein VJ179_02915 [Patescibacteria group bacterium]|nr:hypothetical protein [Patescibacteria group bacterium]
MKKESQKITEQAGSKIELYKYYVIPFIAIGCVALLFFFIVIPQMNTITDARKTLSEEKGKLLKLQTKVEDLKSIEKDREYLQEMRNTVNAAIPTMKDPALVISELTDLAFDSNTVITAVQMSPGPIATPSAATRSNMEFTRVAVVFEGLFTDIKTLLEKISQAAPLLGVTDVEVTAEDDPTLPSTATIEMRAYYQSLPESLGEYEDPLPRLTEADVDVLKKVATYQLYGIRPIGTSFGKANPFNR